MKTPSNKITGQPASTDYPALENKREQVSDSIIANLPFTRIVPILDRLADIGARLRRKEISSAAVKGDQ